MLECMCESFMTVYCTATLRKKIMCHGQHWGINIIKFQKQYFVSSDYVMTESQHARTQFPLMQQINNRLRFSSILHRSAANDDCGTIIHLIQRGVNPDFAANRSIHSKNSALHYFDYVSC